MQILKHESGKKDQCPIKCLATELSNNDIIIYQNISNKIEYNLKFIKRQNG